MNIIYMKKIKMISILLIVQFSLVKGQTDFNNIYRAIEVPSQKILNINIDGNLNDWNWIPDVYKYKLKDGVIYGEKLKKTDFEGYFSFAWSKETNWIYFIASVKDDFLNVDTLRSHYFNDNIELAFYSGNCSINVDEPENLLWMSLLCLSKDNKTKGICTVLKGPDWVMKNVRFAKFNSSQTKTKDGKFITNYELGMSLWDDISKEGPEYSKELILKDNGYFRAYVFCIDYDRFFNTELKSSYSYYGGTWCSMPLVHLDPFISSDYNQSNLEILLNSKTK